MLKSIRLKNFQSHRDSLLRFSAGVNAIVGDPQNGKTAILRALSLVATNRPSGFRYHSHFAQQPETLVEVETGDGKVAFTKKDSGASYQVEQQGETFEFPKPGTGVPDKAVEVLNLSALNIQSQLDGPFLIGQSPPEIAREINRITKIDLLDKWTAELNRRKHATNALALQAVRKTEELTAKAEELTPALAAEEVLAQAEAQTQQFEAKRHQWNTLRLAILDLEQIEQETARVETLLRAQPFIEKAEQKIADIGERAVLVALCEELVRCESQTEKLSRFAGMAEEVMGEYEGKRARLSDVKSQIDLLVRFVSEESQIRSLEIEIEANRNAYADRVVASGVCPICFTPATEDIRNHILEHL